MTELLASLCVVLLVVCALGARYFLVVVPRRWRVPLDEALELLARGDHQDLPEVDRLLDEVMNAGPRGRDLSDARFAQAFAGALLGVHDADRCRTAAAFVDSIAAAGGHSVATAYLALWLQNKLERHDRVVDLYYEHEFLSERPDARRIVAVSHLRLADAHWRRRETDGAMHHFDRVRDLGVLTDEIPKAAENLHILKGIRCVFEQRHDDARAAFTTARERAGESGLAAIEADLGLVVCDWRDDPALVDERLTRIVERIGHLTADVDDEYRNLLAAAVHLLRLVALLRKWAARPALSGAPSGEDRLELWRRAHALREADEELGDPYLIEGLTTYYFAVDEIERKSALTMLEEGMRAAKGIIVPEVLSLVEKERALGGQGDALSRFLRLVYEFLADPAISAAHRTEYRTLRDRFARYGDAPDGEKVLEPRPPASAQDPRRRIDALRRRIELIVYPRLRDLPEDAPSRQGLRSRLEELDEVADAYTEHAEILHRTQHQLVMATGEFLLPQEENGDTVAHADDLDQVKAQATAGPGEPVGPPAPDRVSSGT